MKRKQALFACALLWLGLCLFPPPAHAYIGPGAGVSAIGALLAVVAAILAALFGFVWYPIKRLIQRAKSNRQKSKDPGPA